MYPRALAFQRCERLDAPKSIIPIKSVKLLLVPPQRKVQNPNPSKMTLLYYFCTCILLSLPVIFIFRSPRAYPLPTFGVQHTCTCTARFFWAGPTSFLPAPRVSNTNALGIVARAGAKNINYANCYSVGGALAGSDARRRGGGATTVYSRSGLASSFRSMPLKMMAGECVGGTDISRVLFVCLYNIMTRWV